MIASRSRRCIRLQSLLNRRRQEPRTQGRVALQELHRSRRLRRDRYIRQCLLRRARPRKRTRRSNRLLCRQRTSSAGHRHCQLIIDTELRFKRVSVDNERLKLPRPLTTKLATTEFKCSAQNVAHKSARPSSFAHLAVNQKLVAR